MIITTITCLTVLHQANIHSLHSEVIGFNTDTVLPFDTLCFSAISQPTRKTYSYSIVGLFNRIIPK